MQYWPHAIKAVRPRGWFLFSLYIEGNLELEAKSNRCTQAPWRIWESDPIHGWSGMCMYVYMPSLRELSLLISKKGVCCWRVYWLAHLIVAYIFMSLQPKVWPSSNATHMQRLQTLAPLFINAFIAIIHFKLTFCCISFVRHGNICDLSQILKHCIRGTVLRDSAIISQTTSQITR